MPTSPHQGIEATREDPYSHSMLEGAMVTASELIVGDTHRLFTDSLYRRSRLIAGLGVIVASSIVMKNTEGALEAFSFGVGAVSAPGTVNSLIAEVGTKFSSRQQG